MATSRVVLHYPRQQVDEPIVSKAVDKFDLAFNILRADITPESEGVLALELEGTEQNVQQALEWMRQSGVSVQPLEKDVVRDDEGCTQCGACVVLCPTGALWKDIDSQEVSFDPQRCTACELCVPACPTRAMSVQF